MQNRPEIDKAPTAPTVEALNVKTQLLTEGSNMPNSTAVTTNKAITVPFHGAELYVVEHNGQPYTPMKPIVEGVGVSWQGQHEKLTANHERWGIKEILIPSKGGLQAMLSLPLRKLAGWLMTLSPNKIKNPDVRTRVIRYQNECDDVLWQYWSEGVAVNPRIAFKVNPGDALTADEAETLRLLLKTAADRLPKEKRGALMVQGWSKLKAHFKVGYRDIPRSEFSEAVSIIARHTAEWEVVDDTPLLGQHKALAELPRLHLYQRPPAIGTYRYDRTNPYPRNGRTIEVAKSITADIRNWSENLPVGQARNDLRDATQMLYDLLVSGWTEVDEALGQLHTAMHYLNRWQGRGGRIGNVA